MAEKKPSVKNRPAQQMACVHEEKARYTFNQAEGGAAVTVLVCEKCRCVYVEVSE